MSTGKWTEAGVPHRGWTCTDIEDLGSSDRVCEMCESQQIRYVHYMSHPSFVGVLACGCDCAGHMEGDSVCAEIRDRSMRNSAKRRRNFPNLKGWKISDKGNWTIKKGGMRVTVFRQNKLYKFVINHSKLPDGKFSRLAFDSEAEAKLAAFDAMNWIEANWSGCI